MNPETRRIVESPLFQGADEIIAYTLTTTPWANSPASLTVKIFSVDSAGALTDVSSTKLSGSASAVGDVITTPLVTSLAAGTEYRLEIKWVSSGNTFETYAIIYGQV
jgi:hypothetical protein